MEESNAAPIPSKEFLEEQPIDVKEKEKRKNKAPIIIGVVIGVIIISVSGWFLYQQFGKPIAEEGPKTSGKVMRIAKYYWPGQYWIEIADQKGWFEEAGLNVEIVDTNPDYYGSLQDTVDDKLDIAIFVLFDLIVFNSNEANLVSIINADISSGADAIVVNKNINDVAELKGKKVGVALNSFADYMLDVALNANGLSSEDVVKVDVQLEDIQPFVANEIEGFVTFQPFVNEAVDQGNGRIIFDSSEISGLIPDVFTSRKSFIEERPEDVQVFVNVWHKTTKFIKENPDEAFGIIARLYGESVEDVAAFAEEVKILDLRENKTAFSYAAGFESLHGTASRINKFMIDNGIIDKKLDSTEFLDARFIRAIK
jgi:NitT/TauT family transport system substrate-binding protein